MKNLSLIPHTFMAVIIAMGLFAFVNPAGAQTFLDIDFENQTVGTRMYQQSTNPFTGTPNVGTIDTTLNNDASGGSEFDGGVLQIQNASLTRSSGKVFILEAEYAGGTTYTPPLDYADDLSTGLGADRAREPAVEFFTSSTASIANNPILSSQPLYASFDFGRHGDSGQFRWIALENDLGQPLFRVAPVYNNGVTRIEYGSGGVFLADQDSTGVNLGFRPNPGESLSWLFTLDLAAGTFRLDIDSELADRDWSTGDLAFLSTASAFNVNSLRFGEDSEIGGQVWELDNLQIYSVPEPSTVLLLVCGAGLLWRYRRRR